MLLFFSTFASELGAASSRSLGLVKVKTMIKMKRVCLVIAVFMAGLLFCTGVKAQPKAVGLRFGYVMEVSYQHSLGNGFLEAGLGLPGYYAGISLTGTYNWVAYQNNTAKRDHFEFFLGGGLGLHVNFWRYAYPLYYDASSEWYTRVGFGPMGSIGVQYQFSFPFQIGLSWRPMFGVAMGSGGTGFYWPGLYDGGIALRYVF